jgi:hypothetical protein
MPRICGDGRLCGQVGAKSLATRDVAALNDLVDPATGVDCIAPPARLEQFAPLNASRFGGGHSTLKMFSRTAEPIQVVLRQHLRERDGEFSLRGATNSTQAIYASALNFNSNDWTTIQDDLEFATDRSLFYQEL